MIRLNFFIYLAAIHLLSSALAADCRKFATTIPTADGRTILTRRDLEECLPFVGRNPAEKAVAENIWKAIKSIYNQAEDVPIHIYKNMGWILAGILLNDLRNMTLDQGELIKIFGSSDGLTDEQMQLITGKVKEDWVNKSPSDYSEYDLMLLGRILCYFNRTEIAQIHPDAYRGAAKSIGKLKNCPLEVLQSFAKLAIQLSAYGPPSGWTKYTVSEVGVVVAGLSDDEYSSIDAEILEHNKRILHQINSARQPNGTSTNSRAVGSNLNVTNFPNRQMD